MDINDINITSWMNENPGINPICFFNKMQYYTIEELKNVYQLLYSKNIRGRYANDFNWIWKKLLKITEENIKEPRYQYLHDLEKENLQFKQENMDLRIKIKKLQYKLKHK